MAVPTRPTKGSTGTTSYASDTIIYAAELEDESVALFNAFTDLDDSNIKAAADIASTKIGDYSASAAEQKTVTDPGSGGSLSAATTINGELERLRFAIERLAIGMDGSTHAKRNAGAGNLDCSWMEYPARPENLALNGSFDLKQSAVTTAAPDEWALVGDPVSLTLGTTDVSEGVGNMCTIVTNAATEGMKKTFTEIKASTRYLVSVRAKAATGKTARMVTVGANAASGFRDITLDTTSTSFVTLKAIVESDSTPTAIVVSLLGVENPSTVTFDHFSFQECSKEVSAPSTRSFNKRTVVSTLKTFNAASFVTTGLSTDVAAPYSGMRFEVTGVINIFSSNNVTYVSIFEDAVEKFRTVINPSTSAIASVFVRYVNAAPTVGVTYTYDVKVHVVSGSAVMNYDVATSAPNSSLDVSVI